MAEAGFHSLGTGADILCRISLCFEDLSVHCGMLSSISDFNLLDASSRKHFLAYVSHILGSYVH